MHQRGLFYITQPPVIGDNCQVHAWYMALDELL